MQVKVRTRCKNPTCKTYITCPECRGTGWGEEEWKSADVIFSGLNERIMQLTERIERLEAALANVAVDAKLHIERLEEGRRLLIERSHDHQRQIQRLEAVIIGLSNGICSTYPDAGEMHTHQVYVTNGVRDLVKEIELQRWAEADAAQEEHERQIDEEANHCPRCGKPYKDSPLGVAGWLGDLCVECESELAEEQATLGNSALPFDTYL